MNPRNSDRSLNEANAKLFCNFYFMLYRMEKNPCKTLIKPCAKKIAEIVTGKELKSIKSAII